MLLGMNFSGTCFIELAFCILYILSFLLEKLHNSVSDSTQSAHIAVSPFVGTPPHHRVTKVKFQQRSQQVHNKAPCKKFLYM